MKARRKRSELSLDDCSRVISEFSSRIIRHMETSANPFTFNEVCLEGQIGVVFLVKGDFGVADDLFEAMRVLRGAKLPRKLNP